MVCVCVNDNSFRLAQELYVMRTAVKR